jgi:phosphoglucosamine mutase
LPASETRRLFGTDGVRGQANVDLTPELVMDLARAAGHGLEGPVLVGRDTRRSGDMLSAALQAGFHSVGVDTVDVEVMPVGGISFLTRDSGARMGAVVSASHNPAPDNGVKFLSRTGAKLPDSEEARIEQRLRQGPPWKQAVGDLVGMRLAMSDALPRYLDFLAEPMPYTLRGVRLAVDCANGAAVRVAPALFERLKAEVTYFGIEPDGTNINQECGSTHPEYLARQAPGLLGLAFDGDADRLICVDEEGQPASGDVVMTILASYWKQQGWLRRNTVVSTVMANLGFRRAMEDLDIKVVETQVGDRYVLDAMRSHRAVMGGEQSGHIILMDRATTGDGLLTAVRLLEVVAATGQTLAELRKLITEYPQVLRNLRVPGKEALPGATVLWEAVREMEGRLGDEGRVLVRASGTEPVVRIMVEAPTAPDATSIADELVSIARRELGEEAPAPT